MAKEILRKQSFSLGLETTPGTSVAAAVSIPVEKANLKHVITKVKDTNGFGVIDEVSGSNISKEESEFSFDAILRSQSFGYFLKMALGTAGSATLVETGVYTHAFTRLNSNAHPTATIYRDGANADELAPFHVLETLEVDIKVGEYVKYSATTKGGKIATATYTPSFLTGTSDEPMLASKATVKFATDIAGLSGASAVDIQSLKFTIKKNSQGIFSLGSTTLSANVNQQFGVMGDMEIVYDSNTYRDLQTANTKQAVEIQITGSTLIGATKYNQITIQLAQITLESWDRSDSLDNIITQTFGFTAEYNFTNTQTMNVVLQNTKSSNY